MLHGSTSGKRHHDPLRFAKHEPKGSRRNVGNEGALRHLVEQRVGACGHLQTSQVGAETRMGPAGEREVPGGIGTIEPEDVWVREDGRIAIGARK